MLGVESIEGMNIQRRISDIVGLGHSASVVYAQKAPSDDLQKVEKKPIIFNRNISKFTAEQ